MESLEDRKLMTVMTEFVELSRPDQIGSEHWPEPAAEVAVEKLIPSRLDLHNNGAFLPWHRGYMKSAVDVGRNDFYRPNPTGDIKADTLSMTGRRTSDSFTPTTDLPDGDYFVQGKSQPTGRNFEEIARGQKNDAAYIKFDGIMDSADSDGLDEIARGQKNDAAYIKFDGIMGASKTPTPHAAIDQLFSLVGEGGMSLADGTWYWK